MDYVGEREQADLRRKRWEVVVVRFYNQISLEDDVECIEEIPVEVLNTISFFSYYEMLRPLAAADLKAGVSVKMICVRYKVSRKWVRNLKEKFKL